MTYFYVSILALIGLASAFVLFPLLRLKRQAEQELSNANVVKQRITELEQEVEEGLIAASDKADAINELKIALVDETITPTGSQKPFNLGIFMLLGIPALAIGAWVYIEANQFSGLQQYQQAKVDVIALREQMQANGGAELTPDDFAVLALSIRGALRENPEDATGWSTLGLVNSSIGRIEESVAAYEKSLDINPQNDRVRFKYTEALMISDDEDNLQNAVRQLDYLISKDTSNRNYRLLMTTVAIKLQDAALASTHFNEIRQQLDPNSGFYQSLVTELDALGVNVSSLLAPYADVANTSNDIGDASNEMLIQINVSDVLRSQVDNSAYLVIYAQNAESQSRAPLAVKRMPVSNFPIEVSLSDNDAMISSMNLSSATLVNVTARISSSADVTPQTGDFEGSQMNIALPLDINSKVSILINEELK